MKTFVVAVLCVVAVGCFQTHQRSGESPIIDDDGRSDRDGGLIDEWPATSMDGGLDGGRDAGGDGDAGLDGGSFDAGGDGDAGLDGGSFDAGRDAMTDADVSNDAGKDAEPDDEQCIGPLSPPILWGSPDDPEMKSLTSGGFAGGLDWRSRAFLRFTGAIPGQHYAITLTQGTDMTLAAFAEDMTFTEASCTKHLSVGEAIEGRVTCDVMAIHNTIDVAVDAQLKAQLFYVYITTVLPAQGTAEEPLAIAVPGDNTYEGVASIIGPSFYEITGLTSGQLYDVSAIGNDDSVQLTVYDNAQLSGDDFDAQTSWDAHALGTPIGTSLFIELSGVTTGTTAAIGVVPATAVSEGTREAPIQLDGLTTQQGSIGWAYSASPAPDPDHGDAVSFYELTGLVPGPHTVNLAAPADTLLVVYGDHAAYDSTACVAQTAHRDLASCTTNIAGTSIYVTVSSSGGGGGPIELSVTDSEHTSEGTAAQPYSMSALDSPLDVQVEELLSSYYEFADLTPGQTYQVRPQAFGDEHATIVLFSDPSFSSVLCTLDWHIADHKQCNITASSNVIYAKVDADTHSVSRVIGTVISLELQPIVVADEGTSVAPIAVECSNGVTRGTLGTSGFSYYELTGLDNGTPYLVEGFSEGFVIMDVYGGDTFFDADAEQCISTGEAEASARCVVAPTKGSLFVRLLGYAPGRSFELLVSPLSSSSEGYVGSPLSIDVSTGAGTHYGQVSPDRPSYYELAGLTPDTDYFIRIASVHEDLLLGFFHTPSFDPRYASLSAEPGRPVVTPLMSDSASGNGGTTYFTVELPEGSESTSDFNIDVSLDPGP